MAFGGFCVFYAVSGFFRFSAFAALSSSIHLLFSCFIRTAVRDHSSKANSGFTRTATGQIGVMVWVWVLWSVQLNGWWISCGLKHRIASSQTIVAAKYTKKKQRQVPSSKARYAGDRGLIWRWDDNVWGWNWSDSQCFWLLFSCY